MAILANSPRPPCKNVPIPDDLQPEERLCVAVIRQAMVDLHAPEAHIRAEAVRWWHSPAVQVWDELLNLRGTLTRYSQALVLVGTLLVLPACVPPPGSDAARAVDKVFGVPSAEEQAYCRVVQEYYLKQTPPQLPPSCADLLKAQRGQAVQP